MLKILNIDALKEKAKESIYKPNRNPKNTIVRARKIIKILERDDFQCVECGHKKDLTIDHINGRKFAKHDNAQKYKLDECRTLCRVCHMEKNKNV